MVKHSLCVAVAAIALASALPPDGDAQSRVRSSTAEDSHTAEMQARFRQAARSHIRRELGDILRNRADADQRGNDNQLAGGQTGWANRLFTRQYGDRHAASLYQTGNGNIVGVAQIGERHGATAVQAGNNNVLGILQFGSGQHTTVHQVGNGKADIVIQYGWD